MTIRYCQSAGARSSFICHPFPSDELGLDGFGGFVKNFFSGTNYNAASSKTCLDKDRAYIFDFGAQATVS